MSIIELVPKILNHPIFKGIDEETISKHLNGENIKIRTFEPSSIILAPNDKNSPISIVASGTVEILCHSDHKVLLKTSGAGTIFGVANLYADSHLFPSIVCSKTETKVIMVDKDIFKSMLAAEPKILNNFLVFLSNKVIYLNKKIASYTYNKFNPDCLRNRAICDQYEPGSTFKIVSISAALNESLVNPDDVFDCDIHTVKYKNRVLKLPKEAHKMGKLSVRDITKKSSNKGSAQLGIMLGEKKLYEYASLYGFGKMTNISLSGEISGTLHEVKNWDGLTITRLPMGHAVAATPLQVHCAMSVIANQGIYMQPQVVRRVFNNKGETEMNYPPKAHLKVGPVNR